MARRYGEYRNALPALAAGGLTEIPAALIAPVVVGAAMVWNSIATPWPAAVSESGLAAHFGPALFKRN
jgi:hypothetical protein